MRSGSVNIILLQIFIKARRWKNKEKNKGNKNFCYLVFIGFLVKISQRILTSFLILHRSRMKHKQFILLYDLQASAHIENKYSLNQTLQNANKTRLKGFSFDSSELSTT